MNAIEVRNLGKKFKLFTSQGGRFIEYLSLKKIHRHTDFWALKDITFDVPRGTTLGILGQNGSGKSTLLSILAGVLDRTEGSFTIHGKVSAILELGSGFHPEFSGRDNVYMYGSIMGLSKTEIDEKYLDILQFSELGDFINQPLRTYSSGMVMRLAFSVAVNVNADTLIVDEALAVGDAIFQHRCFRKIREMQEAGKTILYVGHDTEAVRNLCTQAILLDGGHIIERGNPNLVVNKYYALITDRERTYNEGNLIEHGEVPGDEYEIVYDIIQKLPEAKIESESGIQVQPQIVEIHSSPRRVLFAHPPSHITYTLPIEPGTSLAFAIGILPSAWDKIPQGVKFDIIISDGEVSVNIFSRVLEPKRNIGDRGWHNFIIPLENHWGKDVSILFNTTGSGNDISYCWSAWGWMKIIKPCKRIAKNPINQKDNNHQNLFNSLGSANESMKNRKGNQKAKIFFVELLDEQNNQRSTFNFGEIARLRFYIRFDSAMHFHSTAGLTIRNKFQDIYWTNTRFEKKDLPPKKRGESAVVTISFPVKLTAGLYSITPAIAIIHINDDSFSQTDVEILDSLEDQVWMKVVHHIYTGLIDLEAEIEIENEDSLNKKNQININECDHA